MIIKLIIGCSSIYGEIEMLTTRKLVEQKQIRDIVYRYLMNTGRSIKLSSKFAYGYPFWIVRLFYLGRINRKE